MNQSTRLSEGMAFTVLHRLRQACMLICSVSLVIMIVIFAWLVYGRYVLNATPAWVEQLSLILICYITFLGAAIGVHDDTHLGVSFIRESLPRLVRRVPRIVAESLVGVFGLVMLVAGLDLVQFGWSTMLPMLGIPEGVRTLPTVIAGGLIFIFSAARVILMLMTFGDARQQPIRVSEVDEALAEGGL